MPPEFGKCRERAAEKFEMMEIILSENDNVLVEKYFSPYGTPMVPRPFLGLSGDSVTYNKILDIILSRSIHHFSTN